jgi:hypothetical protein
VKTRGEFLDKTFVVSPRYVPVSIQGAFGMAFESNIFSLIA